MTHATTTPRVTTLHKISTTHYTHHHHIIYYII